DVRIHLVTGGMGFVGRALVLELLARTDVNVLCLVRPGNSSKPSHERLHEALGQAAIAYGVEESITAIIADRCQTVDADLDDPLDDVAAELVGRVDQIWHCAASLRYQERDRQAAERTNVGGTERMLRLAATVGASAFHHVSTAYVVGDTDGDLPERPVTAAA